MQADVLIPTYNDNGTLDRAVRSALRLDVVRSVVVVDDGSEPPAAVADAGDARVTLLRQPNQGPSTARNTGIEATSAPWVIFLDADDVLLPTVEACVAAGEACGAAGVVSARRETAPGAPPSSADRLREAPPEWADRPLPAPSDVFRPIALFGASGAIIARHVLAAGVRFDPKLALGEDRDFLRRVADMGQVLVCATPALTVSIHGGGANLTGPGHYARRVEDFVRLADRWHGPESDAHFRAQAKWLANELARTRAADDTWAALATVCAARGWPLPLKARVRRLAAFLTPVRSDGSA